MAALLEVRPKQAGADEVGRGPLAGPVVAAAVVVPEGFDVRGIRDSKKLTPEARETVARRIMAACPYAVVEVDPDEVDRLNVLQASLIGMRRALERLAGHFESVAVDGNRVPYGLRWPVEAVVKGDDRLAAIAAASILAKVYRDARMRDLAAIYPAYGFDLHFGYPTPAHLRALREHGPCPIHRKSFAPVRENLQRLLPEFA